MRTKIVAACACLLIVLGTIPGAGAPGPLAMAAQAGPSISLSANNAAPAVGANFTVTVNLAGASPFASWGAYLAFDVTKVQLVSQAAGTFSTFVPDSRTLAEINAAGTVNAGGFGLADNAGGSGTLGVFTFQAIAAGATSITTEAQSGGNPFGDVLMDSMGMSTLPSVAGPLAITVGAAAVAPAITSALTASGTVGTAFNYSITASNTPTSYNATGLPAGLTVNTATGAISGTPSAAGASNVTISATNATGTGSATLVLTINSVSAATVSLSANTATPALGANFAVTMNLAGASPFASWGAYLAFDVTKVQLVSQAAGTFSTFVPDSRTLAEINAAGTVNAGGFGLADNAGGSGTLGVFTFQAIAAGATSITTEAQSGGNPFGDVLVDSMSMSTLPSVAGPLAITVGTTPTPAITSALTASGTAGTAFNYSITASNTPTSYNATGLPAGLSVNTATGAISGTPSAAGTSNVTISATNAGGTGSATLVLTVNAASTIPAITSAATASGMTGAAFNYSITATNTPTSYNATGLPAGLSVNTATGAISGTPSAAGTSNVTISATNVSGTGSANLSVIISAAPAAPVITSTLTATGTTGAVFNYSITATNTPTSYDAIGLPAGLAINTATGAITGTPSAVGTANVTIIAANAGGTTNATLVLTISAAAQPPTITSPLSATGTVGTAFSYQITASAVPTSYNATGLPAGLSVNTATGVISGTPSAAGAANITVSATTASGTGSDVLTLTINDVTAAVLSLSADTTTPAIGATFAVTVNLAGAPPFASWGKYLAFDVTKVQLVSQAAGTFSTFVPDSRTLAEINASGTVNAGGFGLADNAGGNGTLGVFTFQAIAAGASSITTEVQSAANPFGDVLMNALGVGITPTLGGPLALTVGGGTPAPVITSALTASGTAGTPFSYSITASNTPTSYNATGLPAGLSVNTATGVISGTPTAAGTTNVTVSATNAGGTASATLAVAINPAAPVITSALMAVGNAGTVFNYTITASNSPTSFNAVGLPAGLLINTVTGAISGTPAASGGSNVTISATNVTGTGSATLALMINAPVPAVTSALAASGTVGSAFSYTITASNGPTSFNAVGLPAGLSVNTATGAISGTPSAQGTANVTISAANVSGTGSATLVLTIGSASPAITSTLSASGIVGTAFNYAITATNTPTSYGATGLPAGLSVNIATGAISGTPSAAGTSNVTISATNAFGSGSANLALTVTAPAAPVITSTLSASGTTGAAFNYAITASNTPTSYDAIGLPAGLSINTTTGVISGTPTGSGTANVTIVAVNAGGTTTATLVLAVSATAQPPVITSALSAVGMAGIPFSYQITASNIPVSYDAVTLPAGLSVNTATGVISGTPTAAGTTNVTISATNAAGTGSNILTLTINNATSTVLSLSSDTASPVIGANVTVTVNLTGSTPFASWGQFLAFDPAKIQLVSQAAGTFATFVADSRTLAEINATGTINAGGFGLADNTGGNGTLGVFTFQTIALGATSITTEIQSDANPFGDVLVDSMGMGMTPMLGGPLNIVVTSPAPAITSALTASGAAGSAFSYTITGSNNPNGYDAVGLPAGLAVNAATGVISGTPAVTGTTNVTISATNGGGTGSATLAITINGSAPVITSALTASGTAGSALSYAITATGSPTSFNAVGVPAGLAIDAVTGVISGTPAAAGTANITISASNAGGTGSAVLVLTIVPPAPVINSTLTASGTAGAAFSYAITATNSPTSFSAMGLPAGLAVDSVTGIISGTPAAAGTANVMISATNAGGTGNASLAITIAAAPQPPVITSVLLDGGTVAIPFSYAITATNTPTSYDAMGLPAGLLVDAVTGVISGTPTAPGTSSVMISAANAAGTGSATLVLTFNLTVQSPVITSLLAAAGTAEASFSYTITATNTPTSYDATGLPAGLLVNTTTGAISGTPTVDGTFNVTIIATNAAGTGSATMVLTIAPSKPVITSVLRSTGTVGVPFAYAITASHNPTSFNATMLPDGLVVDTVTGAISGTPTAPGMHNVTLSATNVTGTGSKILSLVIDPTNLAAKETLGKQLFFEPALSGPPTQSCATCHAPSAAFADPRVGFPTSHGAVETRAGLRNAPSAAYAFAGPQALAQFNGQYAGGLFWDGRANTLEEQAMGPLLNPLEMNNPDKDTVVAKVMASSSATLFAEVYGAGIFADVNAAFNAIADAMAAYERSHEVNPFTSKLDFFMARKASLTASEREGMMLFNGKGSCVECHTAGPQMNRMCPDGCACGCAFTGVCTCGPMCPCSCTPRGVVACVGGCVCGCAGTGLCTCGPACTCGCPTSTANQCIGGCKCGCSFTGVCTCGPTCTCGCPSAPEACTGGCTCGCATTGICNCGAMCDCGCPSGGMSNGRPLFTNHGYFNLGVPKNLENPFYTNASIYNPDGAAYVDLGLGETLAARGVPGADLENGKFRVPSLRNCEKTVPYMHNGVFTDLKTVIDFYNTRDVVAMNWPAPEVNHANIFRQTAWGNTMGNLQLTDQEVSSLVAFLKTLTDGYVPADLGVVAAPLEAELEIENESQRTSTMTITISNVGQQTLNYTVSADVPWVTFTPASGSATTEQDSIVVTFDRTGMPVGTFTGQITVTDPTAPANTTTLPVQLTVAAAPSAAAPTLTSSGHSGGGGACGSVGFDLMAPLGLLWLARRIIRRRRLEDRR